MPWNVDATLSLEAGQARGSGGCNDFGSRYELDGVALTFGVPDTTDVGCTASVMDVEIAFMAALPEVASWAIDSGTGGYRGLHLYDAAGDIILTFEKPSISLTPSDISSLSQLLEDQQAQIDRLAERLDSVRIGTLRDRVKALEDAVKQLTVAATRPGSTFSSAERTLLRGVPTRIRSTCRSLRGSGLPSGTLAAVRCDPGAGVVSEMAYYLLPYRAAERTFTTLLTDKGAPGRFSCPEGRAGQALLSPYHATGCSVDGGRANVRLVAWAADCHELDVAGRRVRSRPSTWRSRAVAAASGPSTSGPPTPMSQCWGRSGRTCLTEHATLARMSRRPVVERCRVGACPAVQRSGWRTWSHHRLIGAVSAWRWSPA